MIQSISMALPVQTGKTANKITTPNEAQQSFANELKNAINQVNQYQVQSDQLTDKLIRGENVELHDVMIAAQKANITLNATVEVRNKVIEAYQEMMRMNI